jgi:hypothetical protein
MKRKRWTWQTKAASYVPYRETIGGVVNEQAENVEASGLRQRRKRINGV